MGQAGFQQLRRDSVLPWQAQPAAAGAGVVPGVIPGLPCAEPGAGL